MTHQHKGVKETVVEIVRAHFELGAEDALSLSTDVYSDLGGDSLDMAEIGMTAEDHFDVDAQEGEASPRTIGDVVQMVEAALAVRAG